MAIDAELLRGQIEVDGRRVNYARGGRGLPVVFLHFCLSFPERRLVTRRAWIIPAAYMPALALAGAAVASQVLFVTTPGSEVLWRITSAIDRWKPLYFAALFAISFGILLDSYRTTRSLTARKQMKWLVWGTGAGVLPFFLFYSIPFALGREPVEKEVATAKKFLAAWREKPAQGQKAADVEVSAWAALCQALFGSTEFRFIE